MHPRTSSHSGSHSAPRPTGHHQQTASMRAPNPPQTARSMSSSQPLRLHTQIDLSPRSVNLMSHQNVGGPAAAPSAPQDPGRASSGAAPSIPWLSMMEEDAPSEEDGEEGYGEEDDDVRMAPRSEASFASSAGRRSISLGGGGGGHPGGSRRYASSSVGGSSAVLSGGGGLLGNKPAFLAESVYDGVRSKMKRLQEEARNRDDTIANLRKVRGNTEDVLFFSQASS